MEAASASLGRLLGPAKMTPTVTLTTSTTSTMPLRGEPRHVLAARWRELALHWQRVHAPASSYDRLCRSSELEIDDGERANIRKDIRRSRPDCRFFCFIVWKSIS